MITGLIRHVCLTTQYCAVIESQLIKVIAEDLKHSCTQLRMHVLSIAIDAQLVIHA